MELLFPQFLYGLLALAIPIIVHLFNFRRYKKVYFPTLRFLKQVQEESKKKSELKHFLILISRLLLISALVLAFCQPFIPSELNSYKANVQAIVIDNSYSMDVQLEAGRSLEVAKNSAFDLVNSSEDNADFIFFSADFQNESNQLISKRECLQRIKSVNSSSSIFSVNATQRRIDWIAKNKNISIKSNYFTDLQNGSISEVPQLDSNQRLRIFHLKGTQAANLSIDSCWFEDVIRRVGQEEELKFKVSNYAEENSSVELSLKIDGKVLGKQELNIAANENIESSFKYIVNSPGKHTGELSLNDAPVSFDDKLLFSYEIEASIDVLYISDKKDSLFEAVAQVFSTDSNFILNHYSVSNIDYNRISDHKLIILGELKNLNDGLLRSLNKLLEQGKSLCIIPGEEIDLDSYNTLLNNYNVAKLEEKREEKLRVSEINLESRFFKGVFESIPEQVDLPYFNSYYPSKGELSNNDPLMSLLNGQELFSQTQIDNAYLYLFRAALGSSSSNFTRHALFVPAFLQMGLNSRRNLDLYVTKQEQLLIPKNSKLTEAEDWELSSAIDSQRFLFSSRKDFLLIPDFKGPDGIYQLRNKQSNESLELAINTNRNESNLLSIDKGLIQKLEDVPLIEIIEISNVSQQTNLSGLNDDTQLWKLFVALALLFAAIEIILIKLL